MSFAFVFWEYSEKWIYLLVRYSYDYGKTTLFYEVSL